MKFLHLSDLHIGKTVNGFSMLEDQSYILQQILAIIDEEKPDGVLLAGDLYDKPVPSAEAVNLLDDFLVGLSRRSQKVFMISGNHDSAERIAFGARLLDKSGIYVSPVYDGTVKPVTVRDELGDVSIYLLPFIKPAHVRRFFPDEPIESYTDALRTATRQMNVDTEKRNILVTHQFVTGADRTESEEISVGGTDNVDADVFAMFDYVALGHIHRSQKCTRETIRYCGSPLKYSFSEAKDEKTVTIVELKEKGNIALRALPLKPMRDMQKLRGTYDELMLKSFYDGTTYRNDYLQITLTDEEDIPDVLAKLRVVYRFIMKLEYDNTRTRHAGQADCVMVEEQKAPLDWFREFYEQQNGCPMREEQETLVKMLLEKIGEDGNETC